MTKHRTETFLASVEEAYDSYLYTEHPLNKDQQQSSWLMVEAKGEFPKGYCVRQRSTNESTGKFRRFTNHNLKGNDPTVWPARAHLWLFPKDFGLTERR